MPIAVSEMPAARHEVLFCPFCEESFEGETTCPEHELALLPFDELPRVVASRRAVRDDKDLPWWEPRFGRAMVAAGCAAAIVGFLGPLAVVTNAHATLDVTGYALAATRLSGAWALLVTPLLVLAVLGWRRSPVRMRSVRVVVPVLGLAIPAVLAWALSGTRHWALGLDGGDFALGWGSYVDVLGATLVIVGGLVLGLVPHAAALPHGAEVDEDARDAITQERPTVPEKKKAKGGKKRR